MEDMLRDIYANDTIQELKFIPINYKKSTNWWILKGATSKKRPDTGIFIIKKMDELFKVAYANNEIPAKELSLLSKENKLNTFKNQSYLIPSENNESISNDTSLTMEKDKRITTIGASSPPSFFEPDVISMHSSIMQIEQLQIEPDSANLTTTIYCM
ncbi:20875_t:CDS:2 [Dentiscutata erythropus]|uniref:20875_t:CDS:1 n=1 Tax=Dentiscutata erythropus TaxID=1348616 RepID=A0A9N8WSQ5_9GLOM|nr:20875_t:CDS:2 [Dentiscutata erythropus]